MNNYNIVVIVFRFNFEGEMSSLVPLCVHKKEFLKIYMKQSKTCKVFNLFIKQQMAKHYCCLSFFEVTSFDPLSSNAIFKFDFHIWVVKI